MRVLTAARAAIAALALTAATACGATGEDMPNADATEQRTTVLFLGDSYTEGTGLTEQQLPSRWATVMADRNGWVEVNAGCNGSGYVRRGLRCGTNYAERIPELADTDPDIIVVSGGVNDLGFETVLARVGIQVTLARLAETFPDARIYVVNGLYYTGDETPEILVALNEALAEECAAAGVTFLDIGDPLVGHPELMAGDGLHPSPAGHALIAELTQAAYDAVA